MSTARRKRGGHVDPFHHRRRRFRATLRILDLWDAFAATPRWFQEHCLRFKFRDPEVVVDPAAAVAPNARAVRIALEKAIRAAEMTLDRHSLPVNDFFSIVGGCHFVLESTRARQRSALPPSIQAFSDRALPVLGACQQAHNLTAARALYSAVAGVLISHSRIDSRAWGVRLERWFEPCGHFATRLLLVSELAQKRQIALDGISRPAFRLPMPVGAAGIGWMSWTPQEIGLSDSVAPLPVYAQSHALHQLRDRLPLACTAPYLEGWLIHNLQWPTIVEKDPRGDLLIEFRLLEYRVGYLVVSVLPDAAVVRTFKFLTMEHTPEARLLRRELGLIRPDLDYLGMQKLPTFTQTDLAADPELRDLLTACGCDQLLSLSEHDDCLVPRPFAADLRRYLNLAA